MIRRTTVARSADRCWLRHENETFFAHVVVVVVVVGNSAVGKRVPMMHRIGLNDGNNAAIIRGPAAG